MTCIRLFTLGVLFGSSFCTAQLRDQRYNLAFEYIANSPRTKNDVIPSLVGEDSSKVTLPISINVSPKLQQLRFSNFPSVYMCLHPGLSMQAVSDSMTVLSREEHTLANIDSSSSELASFSNSKSPMYNLYFTVIRSNKLVAILYPKLPSDRIATSRLINACTFFFLFTAEGTIEKVYCSVTTLNLD